LSSQQIRTGSKPKLADKICNKKKKILEKRKKNKKKKIKKRKKKKRKQTKQTKKQTGQLVGCEYPGEGAIG